MRKLLLTIVGLVALAATSVAVAHGIKGAESERAVSATFTASSAAHVSTRTCTSTDAKTIAVTNGTYTGTASGDPGLTGALTLRAHSVVNTTDNVGVVSGAFRIAVANGRDARGVFTAVYDHGTIAGMLVGRAHDPGARLLANFSATFAPATGFTGAKIGGGTAGGSAVEIGTGACRPQIAHPMQSQARGAISALSPDSITVNGLTCMIPAKSRAAAILPRFGLKVGDLVEIRCDRVNGQNTLARVVKLP
ncbi:MAG TPA: hypothetical protein VE982_05880 [Gaiellaceae bacterium]|nr:hypothetical protein [Gaiellaceae bacterium]